ncbi:MAG: hypothetical protein HY645_04080 [Acidobacteria bacterium]|nr:hypothetical protein [Acidobacteriota bacterium]
MLQVKRVDEKVWGAFDVDGKEVLSLEKSGIIEWQVREFDPTHSHGRGRCLLTFIGADAFQNARTWAEKYRAAQPRLPRRRRAPAHA